MEELTSKEKWLLIESLNHSIAYRMNKRTRMSEIAELKKIKSKLRLPASDTKSEK